MKQMAHLLPEREAIIAQDRGPHGQVLVRGVEDKRSAVLGQRQTKILGRWGDVKFSQESFLMEFIAYGLCE
jgi:hypothetical protein